MKRHTWIACLVVFSVGLVCADASATGLAERRFEVRRSASTGKNVAQAGRELSMANLKLDFHLALHAMLSYKKPSIIDKQLPNWGYELIRHYDNDGTQGYLAVRPRNGDQKTRALIVLPGTAEFRDWLSNIVIWPVKHKVQGKKLPGRVHKGFRDATNKITDSVITDLEREVLRGGGESLATLESMITGHSLGGAESVLLGNALKHSELKLVANRIVPFAAPRSGTEDYANDFDKDLANKENAKTRRYILDMDVIPHVPFASWWKHVARERAVLLTEDGNELYGQSKFGDHFGSNLWKNLTETGTDHFMINYVIRLARELRSRGEQVYLPAEQWVLDTAGKDRVQNAEFRNLFRPGEVTDAMVQKVLRAD